MTDQSDEIITSEEQAVRVKAELLLTRGAAPKRWNVGWLAANVDGAVAIANAAPPQGAGEAVFSVRDDGQVDVFLYF
jgi:hypothetical protein